MIEHIQYKIYKAFPFILIIVGIIITIVLYFIIFSKPKEPIVNIESTEITTELNTVKEPDENTDITITSDYLQNSCTKVELVIIGDWSTGEKYETYYDKTTTTYTKYKLDSDKGGQTQYIKLDTITDFSGLPEELNEIPESLQDIITDTIKTIDINFYSIEKQSDGYAWLNTMLQEGYTLEYIKIKHNYIDVYISKNKQLYRAVITDTYILYNKYTGNLPSEQ